MKKTYDIFKASGMIGFLLVGVLYILTNNISVIRFALLPVTLCTVITACINLKLPEMDKDKGSLSWKNVYHPYSFAILAVGLNTIAFLEEENFLSSPIAIIILISILLSEIVTLIVLYKKKKRH